MKNNQSSIKYTVPNQKIIIVKKSDSGESDLYTIINLDAFNGALSELTPIAFKLYCYLMRNQNKYKSALSRQDVVSVCNISDSSYQKGVKELIDKGYMVQEKGNIYIFYDIPKGNANLDKTIDIIRYEVLFMLDKGNRYEVELKSNISGGTFNFTIFKYQTEEFGEFKVGDIIQCTKGDIGDSIGKQNTLNKYSVISKVKPKKPQKVAPKVIDDDEIPF